MSRKRELRRLKALIRLATNVPLLIGVACIAYAQAVTVLRVYDLFMIMGTLWLMLSLSTVTLRVLIRYLLVRFE